MTVAYLCFSLCLNELAVPTVLVSIAVHSAGISGEFSAAEAPNCLFFILFSSPCVNPDGTAQRLNPVSLSFSP